MKKLLQILQILLVFTGLILGYVHIAVQLMGDDPFEAQIKIVLMSNWLLLSLLSVKLGDFNLAVISGLFGAIWLMVWNLN